MICNQHINCVEVSGASDLLEGDSEWCYLGDSNRHCNFLLDLFLMGERYIDPLQP